MPTKKVFKKAVKKAAKKSAVKKSSSKKSASKKPAKKAVPKAVAVKAVTDSTGVVIMKSVDDPGTASSGKAATLKPTLDKETGALIMVPEDDDDE